MYSGVRDGLALICLAAIGGVIGLLVGDDVREITWNVSAVVAVIGLGMLVLALVRGRRTSP